MAAIDFPASPTNGQSFSAPNGVTYQWQSTPAPGLWIALAGGSVFPSGMIADFAGATAPAGWLMCDGASLLRTDYPSLFAAIGVLYGSVDATHFNVPDLRGRVTAGADPTNLRLGNSSAGGFVGLNSAVLGAASGEQQHTLTVAELAAHVHGISDPTHQHSYAASAPGLIWGAGDFATYSYGGAGSYIGSYSWTEVRATSVAVVSNGSSAGHNVVQPTLIMNKIIKA